MREFAALNVGHATAQKYKSQGVWWRPYSGGLAIVNAGTRAQTITLTGDITYVDAEGSVYQPGCTIELESLTGLVLGIQGRV